MRTRSVFTLTALLSLAVVLTVSSCRLMTGPADGALSLGHLGGGDSTGTGGPPPPPPSGLSFGVSDDSMATAGRLGKLQLFAANHDTLDATVNYTFTGPQGWSGFPATGSLTVPGRGSATADIPVAVPAGTAPGFYLFHYRIEKPSGAELLSGNFSMPAVLPGWRVSSHRACREVGRTFRPCGVLRSAQLAGLSYWLQDRPHRRKGQLS